MHQRRLSMHLGVCSPRSGAVSRYIGCVAPQLQCMCVFFYFPPRGQQQIFYTSIPNHCASYRGIPISYFPYPPNKGKRKERLLPNRPLKSRNKGKYILERVRPALLAIRLLPDAFNFAHIRPSHSRTWTRPACPPETSKPPPLPPPSTATRIGLRTSG